MISVIVPVYNVETYLPRCLNSVLAQTCGELEILLIDDGSTDRSGSICDAYQAKDERIKVFHTENHGLSAARNVGLDHAAGAYILLVDGDDWIDERAVEILFDHAEGNDADVVSCAYCHEWTDRSDLAERIDGPVALEGRQIMDAHILAPYLGHMAWNKLYRRELFSGIRYPEGRCFEDILTTHRLLARAKRAVCIPDALYHYRMRANTISRTYSLSAMIEYWQAHDERYRALVKEYPEHREKLIRDCFSAVSRMCRWYAAFSEDERAKAEPTLRQMQRFSRQNRSIIMRSRYCSLADRVSCVCAATGSFVLFALLNLLVRAYMIRKNRRMFAYRAS